MEKYFEFKTPVTSSLIIKRSEFITNLIPVNSEEEIEEHLKTIRKKYYDATHNCYAYILGTKNNILYKCSDDGEPSKTEFGIFTVLRQWFSYSWLFTKE